MTDLHPGRSGIWACMRCDAEARSFRVLFLRCECSHPATKIVPDTEGGHRRLARYREIYRTDMLK